DTREQLDATVADLTHASGRPAFSAHTETPKDATYGERVKAAGDAFDKAVGSSKITLDKTGAIAAGRTAVAAGETAAAMGSGIVGDIAGAATSLLTQNPERGAHVREALTYRPRTEAGRAGQAYVGALTSPVASVLNKPSSWLEAHGAPVSAQVA